MLANSLYSWRPFVPVAIFSQKAFDTEDHPPRPRESAPRSYQQEAFAAEPEAVTDHKLNSDFNLIGVLRFL